MPIVNHFLHRLRIPASLAKALGPSEAVLDPSRVLLVQLRNLLLDRGPVYALEEWIIPYASHLLDLTPEEVLLLNDDRGGRALDLLFDADRASLMTIVVVQAIREFHLDLTQLHNDSTTITFAGDYTKADGRLVRGKPTVAMARSLANKDHRPDLKQLLWILTVTADGAVPIHYKLDDGNTEDSTTHRETWETLRTLVGGPDFLYVADCKLAVSETMSFIHEQKGRFLTVVPDTRKEVGWFREHLQTHVPGWVDVPLTEEELAAGETLPEWRTVEAPERSREGFRIVWVWGREKERRDQMTRAATVHKALLKLGALEKRLQSSRCKLRTREGVDAAAKRAVEAAAFRWVEYEIREEAQSQFTQEKRGRPGKDTRYRRKECRRFHVEGRRKEDAIAYDAKSDGMFPLITNDEKLTGTELLGKYKYQPYLEKRHEQLKTVHRVAPVNLKKASRIEALLFLYFLTLLVQALIERELRRGMTEEELESLPIYPEDRECASPTTNRVLKLFEETMLHRAWQGEKLVHVEQPKLGEKQRQVLQLLGVPENAYLIRDP